MVERIIYIIILFILLYIEYALYPVDTYGAMHKQNWKYIMAHMHEFKFTQYRKGREWLIYTYTDKDKHVLTAYYYMKDDMLFFKDEKDDYFEHDTEDRKSANKFKEYMKQNAKGLIL